MTFLTFDRKETFFLGKTLLAFCRTSDGWSHWYLQWMFLTKFHFRNERHAGTSEALNFHDLCDRFISSSDQTPLRLAVAIPRRQPARFNHSARVLSRFHTFGLSPIRAYYTAPQIRKVRGSINIRYVEEWILRLGRAGERLVRIMNGLVCMCALNYYLYNVQQSINYLGSSQLAQARLTIGCVICTVGEMRGIHNAGETIDK